MRALSSIDHFMDEGSHRICLKECFPTHYIEHCEMETPSLQESLEGEVELGEALVSDLSDDFKFKNMGKFIAITYNKEILAICDSLLALNEKLCRKDPQQNYYIARIGHDSVARLE